MRASRSYGSVRGARGNSRPYRETLLWCNICKTGGQVSEKNVTKAGTTKPTVSANKKKKTGGRTAKLKSSKWYEGAARSIGITKERSLESRDETIK